MPRFRSTLTRGLALVLSTPALLIGVPVVVVIEWLILVAVGFEGPFRLLVGVFAPPGVGTYLDGQVASLAFANSGAGLLSIFGVIVVRAILLALVTTAAIERLRTGAVTTWALRRTITVFPVTLAANMLGLALLLVGSILGQFLGAAAGLGLLAFVAGMGLALYFTAAAAAIAADEDRGVGAALQRSFRAARMPGSMNLLLAMMFSIGAWAVTLAFAQGGGIGVNPPITDWLWVVAANLLCATFLVVFAIRYLSVADQVPEAPERRPAPAARRRR
jgi:hypothetical protein